MFKMATVAELEAEATRFQAEVGAGFVVRPNSYGLRVECASCHVAATHDRAYALPRVHACG